MPRYYKYYPDYQKLYPGIENRPDVLRVLRASDRKMRYMEEQLKADRFVEDQAEQTAAFIPGREDSLERLMEMEKRQFSDGPTPEEQAVLREDIHRLRRAVGQLKKDHRTVIYLRYWKQMTQEEVAKLLSVTQQSISFREKKALEKLRTLLTEKNF